MTPLEKDFYRMKATTNISFKCLFVSLILSVFLFGCKQESIRFSIDDTGKMNIPIAIDGKPYSFGFDTGASSTTINEKYKDSIAGKCTIIGKSEVQTWNQTLLLDRYSAINFNIGGFQTQTSFFQDSRKTTKAVNFLGMNVISKFYWCFDFDEKVATISKSPLFIFGVKKLELNYSLVQGVMHVTIPINEHSLDLLFDTGYRGVSDSSGAITGSDITLFIDKDSLIAKNDSNNTDMLFQRNSDPGSLMIIKELAIDNYSLKYPVIQFFVPKDSSLKNKFKDKFDGIITSEFLRRYSKFCIDPVNRKLEFYDSKPSKEENAKKQYDQLWANTRGQK